MSAQLSFSKYGKERVRVLRVVRSPNGVQSVHEIDAAVMLEGDFAETYLTGDNSRVVPTDTIKNTVQVLAQGRLGACLEDFALIVARHFLKRYDQVRQATVEIESQPWDRYTPPGAGEHPHTFTGRTNALPFTRATATRASIRLQSGIRNVLLLKSTASAFAGYPKCEYTTLPEAQDRIMATKMEATWTFAPAGSPDYSAANERILAALLKIYATEFSPSLQNTLYLMGQAALAETPEIGDIYLAMPNKHYLPVNLQPFGKENDREIFLPTDDPHGQIEALVSR